MVNGVVSHLLCTMLKVITSVLTRLKAPMHCAKMVTDEECVKGVTLEFTSP